LADTLLLNNRPEELESQAVESELDELNNAAAEAEPSTKKK
jgi:hypothetical protein